MKVRHMDNQYYQENSQLLEAVSRWAEHLRFWIILGLGAPLIVAVLVTLACDLYEVTVPHDEQFYVLDE